MGCIGLGNALMLAKKKAVSIVTIDLKKIEDFNILRLIIFDVYSQKSFVWL